ncbi:MAG: acyl-CoA dehydrogenase family protein [Deltaproteobacteria bacterium]|uniref:Acyl-CoA dehydrogenase family protein n=1 Tax=Candidatus Zymogenus saltonus TaxID=2844893 RepID=A0A9D8PR69_9DELT|nr:acyl-CoA dehydrogenase family protein [Candidatus Zymogenus saltonus]
MDALQGGVVIVDWLMENRGAIDESPINGIDDWKARLEKAAASFPDKFNDLDGAVVGGVVADRVSYAFLSGYRGAVRRIAPGLPKDKIVAYCVTEEKGNHPRAIESILVKTEEVSGNETVWRLNGGKKFVTCAEGAEILLVAASAGTGGDGRNIIKMAVIDSAAEGVALTPTMDLPFIPEIPHSSVIFKDVKVKESQILPGDGYTKYIKSFRTVEDIHVMGGVLGYIFRAASIFGWPREVVQKLLGLIYGLRALSLEDPLSPAVHLTLSGVLLQLNEFVGEIDPLWERADDETKRMWERDRALLSVAEKAREARLNRAWESLGLLF